MKYKQFIEEEQQKNIQLLLGDYERMLRELAEKLNVPMPSVNMKFDYE